MFPVLIGSRALLEYGLIDAKSLCNDIDLVVNNEIAGSLSLACDEKKGKMLFFGPMKIDLHLHLEPSTALLFSKCNDTCMVNLLDMETPTTPSFTCKKIRIEPIGEVLIPPLELLYVIIKSHIHRIVPVTPFQDQNIEIWFKHVAHYKLIRDYLGYTKLDNILYKEYLGDWNEIKLDDSLEDLMRQIYQMRFLETNARIGDTEITLEKSEKEFFDDNVERFINHDELHSEVGRFFRDDPNPIFRKYQTNPEQVDLDRNVFLNSDPAVRIEMLREEVMVLLLERKWIPEIIKCYINMKIPYVNFDYHAKENELRETGANYVTNLCGQGDAWLRRFCLDHVHLLLDAETYEIDKLKDLALILTKYDTQPENIQEKDIMKQISEYKNENFKCIEFLWNMINKFRNKISEKTNHFFGTDKLYTIKYLNINTYSSKNKMDILFFGKEVRYEILRLVDYFDNPFNIGVNINADMFTIYNLVKNVGIYYTRNETKIFTLSFEEKENEDDLSKNVFQTNGSYIDIFGTDKCDFENEYIRKCRYVSYHSGGCEYTEKCSVKFLSSYGSAPTFMKPILEFLAKKSLNLAEHVEIYNPYGCSTYSDYSDYEDDSDYDDGRSY